MFLTASRPARTLTTLLLLLPLVLVCFAGTALAEMVGKLTRIEGAVDIMPGGQLPAQAAREGAAVQKGDFVRTKSNARAELTFNDGSVIKIAPRSRIDVSEYSASDRKLGLPRGKVQAIVVPAAAGSAARTFEIKTPNAIAGVRGTSFYVYHQANITGVAVIEGVVHTASLALPSQGVTLTGGTATTVGRRSAPTPPRPVSERELNRHKDEVTPATGAGAANGSGGTGSGEQGGSSGSSSSAASGTTGSDASAGSTGSTASSSGTDSSTGDTSSSGAAQTTDGSTLGTTAAVTSEGSTLGSTAPLADPTLDLPQLDQFRKDTNDNLLAKGPTDLVPGPSPVPPDSPVAPPPPTLISDPPLNPDPTQEPPPTDPGPTDPGPTDPGPTDPGPTDPGPTDPGPTDPPPTSTQPQFSSLLSPTLMSRDSTIDTSSNLLTIVNDGSMPLVLAGTESLWTGTAQATLTGAYPATTLQQPNHYWFGTVVSGDTANHTTADGGAYIGYFQGMSLDGSGETNSHISALYIDPTGKTGIMQVCLSGTIASGALGMGGTATLTEMTPISGLNPASFSADWMNPQNGVIVELSGPVLTQAGTSISGTSTGTSTIPNATSTIPGGTNTIPNGTSTIPGGTSTIPNGTSTVPGGTSTTTSATLASSGYRGIEGNESEGFMLDGNFNLTSAMSNRGDVLRLAYLSSDPSFGIWTRESFGSYEGNSPMFALVSGADWGTLNPDSTFTLENAIRILSLGSWQAGSGLTGTADGVWGNLQSGSIKLLTGLLTGSSNSATGTFGAVTTGQFIDLTRFINDPVLAGELGFPTVQRPYSFTLSGTSAQGSVTVPNITFYSRSSGDPISLWVATNVSGTYSGDLRFQRFSLMDGTSVTGSSVIGSMHITSSSSATGPGTWLGSIEAQGETGSGFRSQMDGIAAGSFDGTTFTGSAAGLTHPVTYFNTINGGEVRRFSNGSSVLYGKIDGIMAGMSLWNHASGFLSDFRGIGFFTPNQPLSGGDFVMSSEIISKDLPSGTTMTADGGAYNGHLVGGVNTLQSSPGSPSVQGIMNALAIDPDGNAGILHGKYTGFIDPVTNVWMVDGGVSQAVLEVAGSGGVSAAGLNSGGVSTVTTPFSSSGSFFFGTPAPLGFAPDSYSRSFISSSPDWGIGKFGLYAGYSAAPLTGTPWNMDFAIAELAGDYRMTGTMNGNPWDPAVGTLRADTKAFWHDLQAAQAAATPTTGIFIGETVGTFNPVSLQAMTAGIWMETRKYLELVVNKPGELAKLNIPAVEVGRANFSGSNGDINVSLSDLRFFAPVTGGRPQVFATDNVNGTYALPPAVGSALTLTQVPNTGVATSGLAPIFSVNQWDTANGKWAATISYSGSTGLVAGHGNIQMQGTAAGRTSGGTSGTFNGTTAGIVR